MAESGIAGLDTEAIETELSRLPEVVACRIVADSEGRPTEVHVLAHSGKHPKQVVRDVQSVAMASFGLDIDRRIVSVVQLNPPEEPATVDRPLPPGYVGLVAVQSHVEGRRATVRVTLSSSVIEATGFAEGSTAAATRLRLVASAAIDSLRQLDEEAFSLEVDEAAVTRVGSRDVVVVTLIRVDPPEEHEVVGSALTYGPPDVAAVHATLDAASRGLPHLSLVR